MFIFQGYLTLAVYIHNFLPGSLKLRTKIHQIPLGQLGPLIDRTDLDIIAYKTRRVDGERWLPKSEMPYPGYCRAPGSSQCLDSFCNCKALDEQWRKYLENRKKKENIIK